MELLERGAQHAELQGALERARAGAGCIVLVAGEAGIGKTALVDDFTRGLAARTPRVPVLWGACDPLLTPRPLGPLLDVLPQCSATLRTLTESGAERARIFQAFLDELRRAPEPVVVFEDIHWADEATLDLLKFVGRRIRQTTGILIATYRDDEVGNEHPLRRVLGEIPAEALRRIRLPLLSESAVQRLARGAGRSAHRLYALTGGNPFFLTEVLAAEGAEVPASVQDAVLARAARLSAPAREVLGPVSVVPGRTERWLLDAVLGSASGDQVAECAAAGVLVATAASVSFRHELARRAWREALEPGRATMLHARVFDVLMQRGAEHVGFARLVHHAEGANLPEQVLHLAPAAAREASAVGAHREAAAHWGTALRHAQALPAADRAALLEAHSFELHLIADMDEAVRARGQALALRRRLDDRLREGSDLRWLSRLTWFQGRSEEAVRLGHEAVRVLEPLGSTAELAMAYSNLAQLAMLGDQGQDAVAWGERAIVLAGQVGDVETRAHALINVGSARMYAGQEAEGRALLEQALALSLENGFQDHAVRALTNRACFAVHSRNYAAAESFIAAALAFAGEHDIDTFNLYVHGWRARFHLERGDWPAAERDAQVVLGRYRVLDIVRFPALLVLGLLRARRGEPGAHDLLEEAMALATASGELQRIVPATAARAEAAWLAGDLKAAEAETRAGHELAMRSPDRWYRGPLAYWLWRMGSMDSPPDALAEPYRLQVAGEWRGAAVSWQQLGCPYEHALALAEVDDAAAQREALDKLEELGAAAAAQALRRDLRARGIRGIPRGPRPTTRENALGLTRGQARVLALLARGLSNAEIARALFLSPRTVDHHVSAILQRLGVRTRAEAIAAAHTRQLLPPA